MLGVRALAAALALACGCSGSSPASPASPQAPGSDPGLTPIRVLMLTTTAGFRHESIQTARETVAALATPAGFSLTVSEDLSLLSASSLSSFDVVFFALTSGELPLTDAQKTALLAFVTAGKGFIGVHSASDTLYGWPDYGTLLGAYFKEHPWTQSATVIVEDRSHPSTQGLADRFTLAEEFYTFQENPRPRVQVLLRLDATSVGATGDFPLAWTKTYGAGRVYYNALGHFSETWRDGRFQQQITGAIRWAAPR